MADKLPLVTDAGLIEQLQSGDALLYVFFAGAWGTDNVLLASDGTTRTAKATSIDADDVVTAGSAFSGSGVLIAAAGADKTVQGTTIATTDVVTASVAAASSGLVIESAGADKTIQASAVTTSQIVTASSTFAVDESLVLADGTGRGAKASSYIELNLDRWDGTILAMATDYLIFEPFVDVASDGDLHNTVPYVASTSGAAVWTAHANFNKDGTMDSGNSGAFIPFIPQPGFRYYLDVEFETAVQGTGGSGVIIGFGEGLPADRTATGSTNYFGIDDTTGKAVVLLSNDTATQQNALFLGDASDGFATEVTLINSSIALDTDLLAVRLILDTSAPDGVYTCEVQAKRDQDSEWLDASAKKIQLTAQDIGAVGFATNAAGATATVAFFGLWSERVDTTLYAVPPVLGNIIYHEPFAGFSQQDLDASAPPIAPDGVVWQAHNVMQADGTMGAVAGGGGFLPFTPVADRIYYLDIHLEDVTSGASGFGIHLGYCEGLSSSADDTGSDAYMGADPTTGKFTALLVTSASAIDNRTYLGTASAGLSNNVDFTDTTLAQDHGEKIVRLVLDTTYSDGMYRGTCFARLEDDEQWTQVSEVRELVAQDIGAIGITSLGSTTTTKFRSLTLWYEEPELNTVTSETGAGTAYSLTNTSALVDLGTTDPQITLAEQGKYRLEAWAVIDYNGATYASADSVVVTIRRTNNTASDLASVTLVSPIMTSLDDSKFVRVTVPEYLTSENDDAIEIFANVGSTPSAGSVDISQCEITATKLV